LEHRLNPYALAASAAGVSLLALAQPAEAKIVYTKTHHVIGTHGSYNLDLNDDRITDFMIVETGQSSGGQCFSGMLCTGMLRVRVATGNFVEGASGSASALKRGAKIGPGAIFGSGSNGSVLLIIE